MFTVIVSIFLLVIHQGQCGMNATVNLYPPESEINLGTLIFTQDNADSPVRITGSVVRLNASSAHGFHIHAYPVSDGSPNCTEAGPHFNPYNTPHGPPSASITNRHVGDLGNITADEFGEIDIDMEDSIIQLYNETQSIIGRTVVIHHYRDDGGEGGFLDSNTTGNAGPRIICGLIKLVSADPTTTTITTPTATTPESSTTTTNTVSSTSTETPTTNTASSTTNTASTTSQSGSSTTNVQPTTHAAGLNIQPVMFVLIITMIINYIIHY